MTHQKLHSRTSKKGKKFNAGKGNEKQNYRFTSEKKDERAGINVDDIVKYEEGKMNQDEELRFFSKLIKTGMAWKLQGHYGRTAKALIDDGFFDKIGNLTIKGKTYLKGGVNYGKSKI